MTKIRSIVLLWLAACATADRAPGTQGLSSRESAVFLRGSMGSEFIPERVFQALIRTYPDLYPGGTLAAFGAVADPAEEWPVGISRRETEHLGRQRSIGINCAACHVADIEGPSRVRVLGRPGIFDVYSFFGALATAMLRTTEPANMKAFLVNYAPESKEAVARQGEAIARALAEDRFASRGMAAGALHRIEPSELEFDGRDVTPLVKGILKILYNTRTSLAIPEQLPPPVPTIPGPGRTDAFGVLAALLFATPTKMDAPVKYGFAWNLSERRWVHWDGNMDQPIARNLGAALGLGCPMEGQGRRLDFSLVQKQTDVSEKIRAPDYPWEIDSAAAARGMKHYADQCARCHDVGDEARLFSVEEVGTDPNRAKLFDRAQAEHHNRWLAGLKVEGYTAKPDTYRATQKYWANDMAGAWARSPYLHNGSVRTMWDLLTPPSRRPKTFKIGTRRYDPRDLGFRDEGHFVFDATVSGNSNAGHDYGTALPDAAKRDLIEYLKTR